ncbi:MAG: hypothetical protein FWD32_00915, partial [Firmicutes bacterium]|nr:hypothetical protein [Bacillota bacterium]
CSLFSLLFHHLCHYSLAILLKSSCNHNTIFKQYQAFYLTLVRQINKKEHNVFDGNKKTAQGGF